MKNEMSKTIPDKVLSEMAAMMAFRQTLIEKVDAGLMTPDEAVSAMRHDEKTNYPFYHKFFLGQIDSVEKAEKEDAE